jgi:selenocysteine-specific elongation factor
LNLTGVTTEDIARGMTLAPISTFQSTSRVDVSLSLLASASPLKDRARVHFHAYSMETVATVVLYGKKEVAPGEQAFAQLRLAQPALLLPEDRFIVRRFSPVVTIGGGVVLENAPARSARKISNYTDYLEQLEDKSGHSVLRARVMIRGTQGLNITEAVARTGWNREDIISLASGVPEISNISDVLIANLGLDLARKAATLVLSGFHKQNPLVAGMSKEELRGRLANIAPEIFDWSFREGLQAKKIEQVGELVRLPGHGVVMKDEEAESKKIIESAFSLAGLKVPALKDVLAGLKVDKVRAQKIVTLLLREKTLVKISEELVFHRSALENLRKQLAVEKTKSSKIDVARFKDLTGVSRKYAIPLLEYLDREHVTRRVGDSREIL